jgi:hypothetical protein
MIREAGGDVDYIFHAFVFWRCFGAKRSWQPELTPRSARTASGFDVDRSYTIAFYLSPSRFIFPVFRTVEWPSFERPYVIQE